MKTLTPHVRGSHRRSAVLSCLIGLLGAMVAPDASATAQFELIDVWTPTNSDLGGSDGIEPHFVYAIGVDWRDHVLVACEGRYDQSGGDAGTKDLLVRVSRDRGVTWSADAKAEVGGVFSDSWTNPAFVVDGVTTYLFYTGSPTGVGKRVYYREVYNSGSGLVTFGPRVELTSLWDDRVADYGWNSHGPIGHGIKLQKGAYRGRLMLSFHHQNTAGSTPQTKFKANDVLFKDPGGSWQVSTENLEDTLLVPQITATTADDVDPGESRVAERADGSFFLVTRKETNNISTGAHPEYRPRMRVAGTWGSANSINWGGWVNAVGITGTFQVDGGLIKFSDTAHLYSFSNNEAHSARRNLAVRLSTDGGVNWPGSPKVVYGGTTPEAGPTATYSDLARDSLGNIYCIFGRDGMKADGVTPGNHNEGLNAKVTVAKFNLEWVTGTPTPTIRVDNGGTGFSTTGTWTAASSVAGHYGPDYLTSPSGTATARWTPTVGTAGNYEVYIRWTAGADRADAVPIKVKVGSGSPVAQTPLNQKTEGGTWTYVGVFNLPTGTASYVEIAATDAGNTVADCVIFQKQ